MKCKTLLGLMSVGGSVVGAQNAPQRPSADLSAQDKKCAAQITMLQKQIDDLERAITSRQEAIGATAQRTSAQARTTMPYLFPKPALVLNVNGSTFIVNSGRKGEGLRKDDKLLLVRHTQNDWRIDGTGRVERVYDTDADCVVVQNIGIRPEDEVYVVGRRSSPHDASHLGF